MGYELLQALAELLRSAGLQAGEEYPGHPQPQVDSPTAAVASVPREPTIAVSAYCTAVCSNCSSMVGHARAIIVTSRPFELFFIVFINRCFLFKAADIF